MTGPTTIDEIVIKLGKDYKKSLLKDGISIFTPFPELISLKNLNVSNYIKEFITQYEPKASDNGVYSHQKDILEAYSKGKQNFILTSSTGSGKSLAYLSWVIDNLLKNEKATALIAVPTQALMWSQTDRLTKISDNKSLTIPNKTTNLAFGGTINICGKDLSWSIWKGETDDQDMQMHLTSYIFETARIRIATIDKIHYSLIGKSQDFLKNLTCIVLDEAHYYDGIMGANVSYLLKRIHTVKEAMGLPSPNIFLASATLANSKKFAADLTSKKENDIVHIPDKIKPEIKLENISEIIKKLNKPPVGGLYRAVIFNDSLIEELDFSKFINHKENVGETLNILYFSQSKYFSRIANLNRADREVLVYDADIPPLERRKIESAFNSNKTTGINLISTNALELGVDIENLDICCIESMPTNRAAFLQRIGRVGRRTGKAGLILINLFASPFARLLIDDTENAFNSENVKPTPLPLEIEHIKLKNLLALYKELESIQNIYIAKDKLNTSIKKYFGIYITKEKALSTLRDKYSFLIENDNSYWTHKGFRASVSDHKIKIKNGSQVIALIEDIAIFRDVHPGGIYLDDKGKRWKVTKYEGVWKTAKWENPSSDTILGKFLPSLMAVQVIPEKRNITTRGLWKQGFKLYSAIGEIEDGVIPSKGQFDFGIWEYSKTFDGYKIIDLISNKASYITLNQASDEFRASLNKGENSPFLFPLTYMTHGWEWKFPISTTKKEDYLEQINYFVEIILQAFLCNTIQVSNQDLHISLNLKEGILRVLDGCPGGNGASEGLLIENRFSTGINDCLKTLEKFNDYDNIDKFSRWILELCNCEAENGAEEFIQLFSELQSSWTG